MKPVTQMYLADIYRFNSFLLRDIDIEAAIEKANTAADSSQHLAEQHSLIGLYAANVTSQYYNFGLMHFIAKNFDRAEMIFDENVKRCDQVLVKFPLKGRTARINKGNSLTMLGLIHKQNEQWEKQIKVLNKSRDMNHELAKSGRSQFVVSQAGIDAEIALARSRLGEHESATKGINSAVDSLEGILASDPKNGQAKRYLLNNLNRMIEINRRAGNFEDARAALERLVDALGGELKTTLLPHAIEIEIGEGQLEAAIDSLESYHSESNNLRPDQLFFDAIQFCWSIKTLDRTTSDLDKQSKLLREKLVKLAINNLSVWFESTVDGGAPKPDWATRDYFSPLANEPEFVELVADSDKRK